VGLLYRDGSLAGQAEAAQLMVDDICTQANVITQITHGMQVLSSRVPAPSFWLGQKKVLQLSLFFS
jgi:hypothetical protein